MDEEKLPYRAVLIADPAPPRDRISIGQDDLEYVEAEYMDEISGAIAEVCRDLAVYESPRQFLDRIGEHANDVVLSIWSGKGSRNRRALIPSICEAYGIAYVGADTYTNVLCQDKALAKRFAEKYGFESPSAQLVSSRDELVRIRMLRAPLVVKPNFEGGSIGISSDSLVSSHQAAERQCRTLLDLFRQPILVEEFAEGREVSIVLAGRRERIDVLEAVELYLAADPGGLSHRLYSYEVKKAEDGEIVEQRAITSEAPPELLAAARRLFVALEKVEVLRVDGRLRDGRFQLIELSPDVHLGHDASVAVAFAAAGFTYPAMIRLLLENARASRPL